MVDPLLSPSSLILNWITELWAVSCESWFLLAASSASQHFDYCGSFSDSEELGAEMTRMPPLLSSAPMEVVALILNWWDEINESTRWQDGIFYGLSAAYAIVSFVALVSLYLLVHMVQFSVWFDFVLNWNGNLIFYEFECRVLGSEFSITNYLNTANPIYQFWIMVLIDCFISAVYSLYDSSANTCHCHCWCV